MNKGSKGTIKKCRKIKWEINEENKKYKKTNQKPKETEAC
jgi:hypothetical protein